MKRTGPTAMPPQTPTKATKSAPNLQEQIRLRAYGLYEQRGRDGHEVEDWLQAESEVTQQKTKTIVT
ncbi:MAG: DUF2934 domain-containing protein [Candidatus Sulfotelmatobacter sp.]|jgi:hypothetical protein